MVLLMAIMVLMTAMVLLMAVMVLMTARVLLMTVIFLLMTVILFPMTIMVFLMTIKVQLLQEMRRRAWETHNDLLAIQMDMAAFFPTLGDKGLGVRALHIVNTTR